MAGQKDVYGRDQDHQESLLAPSTPQIKPLEHTDKPLYVSEKLHPNHTLPAYRPPNSEHPESPLVCTFDRNARPTRLKKKKKTD